MKGKWGKIKQRKCVIVCPPSAAKRKAPSKKGRGAKGRRGEGNTGRSSRYPHEVLLFYVMFCLFWQTSFVSFLLPFCVMFLLFSNVTSIFFSPPVGSVLRVLWIVGARSSA